MHFKCKKRRPPKKTLFSGKYITSQRYGMNRIIEEGSPLLTRGQNGIHLDRLYSPLTAVYSQVAKNKRLPFQGVYYVLVKKFYQLR